MVSFSASISMWSFSWSSWFCLASCMVILLTRVEIRAIPMKVMGYPDSVKSSVI